MRSKNHQRTDENVTSAHDKQVKHFEIQGYRSMGWKDLTDSIDMERLFPHFLVQSPPRQTFFPQHVGVSTVIWPFVGYHWSLCCVGGRNLNLIEYYAPFKVPTAQEESSHVLVIIVLNMSARNLVFSIAEDGKDNQRTISTGDENDRVF